MKRAGRSKALTRSDLNEAIRLRRAGMAIKAIAARFKISERTAKNYLEAHGLTRKRNTLLVLLQTTRGAQRLDLARVILDLDELASIEAPERTVEALDRIRGLSTHRNQFARMRDWCRSVGVKLEKVEAREGSEALIELDVKALRRVITTRVVEVATAIRLEYQARTSAKETGE